MKLVIILFSVFSFASYIYSSERDKFQVLLEPFWEDLENDSQRAEIFGGKWILAGSITFKKKAKDTLHLNKMYLQWTGKKIENLIASLYLKNDEEKFLPIQENLICDGIWNKNNQTLMLHFEEDLTLGPTNVFYLVLTVPRTLESILKKGKFTLLPSYLPEPYRMAARQNRLAIAYNQIPLANQHSFHKHNTHISIDVIDAP